jgi:hypothetical protein
MNTLNRSLKADPKAPPKQGLHPRPKQGLTLSLNKAYTHSLNKA